MQLTPLRVGLAGLALCVLLGTSTGAEPGVAQVRFSGPAGMKLWVQRAGTGRFPRDPDLTAPGRLNLYQGGTYRLKLADIPGRPGLTLYPTLTLAAGDARAAGFLRHSAIGLELTGEDFDEAAAGRLITRTVSLPDGTILAVLRMGNLDLESGFPDR